MRYNVISSEIIASEFLLMNFHQSIKSKLIDSLSHDSVHEISQLNEALRLLSKWRSLLIVNTYKKNHGLIIFQGPFKDIEFLEKSSEGCHMAKLFGTYEQPLHQYIEEIISSNYQTIFNIGSAEGYYSVGLAKRMPKTNILSFDIDISAQKACLELATKNNLQDLINIKAEFHPSILSDYKDSKNLILCDVEGEERKLLDIENYKVLKEIDILVESHECLQPGITKELITKFSATHKIIVIQDNGQRSLSIQPDWFLNLSHLDQLLAVWEWRSGPTPWLFMKSKL